MPPGAAGNSRPQAPRARQRPPLAGGPLPSDSAVKQQGYFTSVIFSIFS